MTDRQVDSYLFGDDASQHFQGPRGTPETEGLGSSVQDFLDVPENVLINFAPSILATTIPQRGFPKGLEALHDAPCSRGGAADLQGCGTSAHPLVDFEDDSAADELDGISGLLAKLFDTSPCRAIQEQDRIHFETSPSLCRSPSRVWTKRYKGGLPPFGFHVNSGYFGSCETI
jgi:hypothetical protein